MGRRVVRDVDGREWVVRRRWVPRGPSFVRRYWRRHVVALFRREREIEPEPNQKPGEKKGRWGVADGAGCLLEGLSESFWVLVAVVVVAALVWFVVLPVLFALVDLVVLVVLVGGGVVARVVFRRPWTIEATAGDGSRHRWDVVGWRASRARRDEIATTLAAGVVPAEGRVIDPRQPGAAR